MACKGNPDVEREKKNGQLTLAVEMPVEIVGRKKLEITQKMKTLEDDLSAKDARKRLLSNDADFSASLFSDLGGSLFNKGAAATGQAEEA